VNPKFFGDSYDCVKRVFCTELQVLGYEVYIDPMFTDTWESDQEKMFYALLGGVKRFQNIPPNTGKTALFLDPDTGIKETGTKKHVSLECIAVAVKEWAIVFVFDQSFSFRQDRNELMQEKLKGLNERNCHAFYYDSHARFLFASHDQTKLAAVQTHLFNLGLPRRRIVPLL